MSKKSYRIVFFGTSDFSVPILERLHADERFDVVTAVTQPDRPVGRHAALKAPPVKRLAQTRGIPIYQPESLKDGSVLARLKDLDAELFVVVSYGKILPKAVLDIPKRGAINIHASFLPKYRGASPIAGAIIAGEDVTGITVMLMNAKMDEGPTLAFSEDVPITHDDTTVTLTEKLQRVAASMISPTLVEYLEERIEPKPQDHAKATYTPILLKKDGHIDWHGDAISIHRRMRGLCGWPGNYAVWNRGDKSIRINIKCAEIAHGGTSCSLKGKPGQVSRGTDGALHVDCGKGCLTVTHLQPEGKRETDGPAFLNGYPDIVGQVLE